jgi:cytochrome c553
MHRSLLLLSLVVSSSPAGASPPPGGGPPAWAYPVNPPGLTESPDDGSRLRVPDSDAAFTLTQIRDLNSCPDWHPNDHPPMPEIVAWGRRPAVLACGSCHRADGSGGPENARVAGLPITCIAQQLADFKRGARKTSVPGRNPERMVEVAQAITDGEIKAAANYFSALKPRSAIRLVEALNAPRTRVVDWQVAAAPFIAAATSSVKKLKPGARRRDHPKVVPKLAHDGRERSHIRLDLANSRKNLSTEPQARPPLQHLEPRLTRGTRHPARAYNYHGSHYFPETPVIYSLAISMQAHMA